MEEMLRVTDMLLRRTSAQAVGQSMASMVQAHCLSEVWLSQFNLSDQAALEQSLSWHDPAFLPQVLPQSFCPVALGFGGLSPSTHDSVEAAQLHLFCSVWSLRADVVFMVSVRITDQLFNWFVGALAMHCPNCLACWVIQTRALDCLLSTFQGDTIGGYLCISQLGLFRKLWRFYSLSIGPVCGPCRAGSRFHCVVYFGPYFVQTKQSRQACDPFLFYPKTLFFISKGILRVNSSSEWTHCTSSLTLFSWPQRWHVDLKWNRTYSYRR